MIAYMFHAIGGIQSDNWTDFIYSFFDDKFRKF